MDFMIDTKPNPFLSNDLEALCIVCNQELDKCKSASVQDDLPNAEKSTILFEALKVLSDFAELNIDTKALRICVTCFCKAEFAWSFHLLCNKSVENIKAYINQQERQNNEEDINNIKQKVNESQQNDINDSHLEGLGHTRVKSEANSETNRKINEKEHVDDSNIDTREILDDKDAVKLNKLKSARRRKGLRVECPHCHKMYRRDYLRFHIRTHTGEMPYKCNFCDKRFSNPTGCSTHMLTHNDNRPFLCTFCGNRFRLRTDLTKHVRMHTDERPYTCEICGNAFRTSQTRKHHIAMTHSEEKLFSCKWCPKSFKLNKQLMQHQVVHAKVKPIQCTFCGKRFTQKHVLKTHQAKSCQGINNN